MRKLATAEELFDILAGMRPGRFATIAYVSSANLNIPQVKRRNPESNRMKNFDDWETFGKELGVEDNIAGVVKLTRYTLNWSSADNFAKQYGDYKKGYDEIRQKYGLEASGNRESTHKRVKFGKGDDVKVYKGDNEDLTNNSYTEQNVYGAKMSVGYYLIRDDGSLVKELSNEDVKKYLKARETVGVAALRKLGKDDATIQSYIDDIKNLKMNYVKFETSSILYIITTIGTEKVMFINNNLSRKLNDVVVSPDTFIQIATDKYNQDAALTEALNIAADANLVMERVENTQIAQRNG